MDGVLSDTQRLHATCESEILKRYGITASPEEITLRFAGVPDTIFFNQIFSEHKLTPPPLEQITEEKWTLFNSAISKFGISAIPYAVELAKSCHQHGIKLAVASGSPLWFIKQVVAALEVAPYFSALVSSDEVAHGKPAPDIFLEAARRINIPAQNCLVIEDGMSGMHGARAAGMKCIGLISDRTKPWPADMLVESLREVTVEKIAEL